MYTNINIDNCIERITTYLAKIWDRHKCLAVTQAMEIVTRNNCMRFRDLMYQIRGVAMGMLPAPTIKNLTVTMYEQTNILPLLEKYLPFYKRFIDDRFAIWLHNNYSTIDANNWNNFKDIDNGSGLKWTFMTPCKKN